MTVTNEVAGTKSSVSEIAESVGIASVPLVGVAVGVAGRVLVGVGSRMVVAMVSVGVGSISGGAIGVSARGVGSMVAGRVVAVAVGSSKISFGRGVTVGSRVKGESLGVAVDAVDVAVMDCVAVMGAPASPSSSLVVEELKGALMGAGGGVTGSKDDRAWVGATQVVNPATVSNRVMNSSKILLRSARRNIAWSVA